MNTELIRDLRSEVDRVVEREDEYWGESSSLNDYFDECDRDEVLKRFSENYTTRQIGFIDRDQMGGEEMLAALRGAGLSAAQIYNLIMTFCEAVARNDIYDHWNDIATVGIGEMEYQIDVSDHPALADLITQATDEELREAGIKDRQSFLAYGRPCELVALKLDAKAFLEATNEILGPEG